LLIVVIQNSLALQKAGLLPRPDMTDTPSVLNWLPSMLIIIALVVVAYSLRK